MNIIYDKSFEKCLDSINDKSIKLKVLKFIELVQEANSLRDINSIKKIQGFKSYYRYRIGDFRLGFELLNDNTICLIVIAKRNDIYKIFP